VRLKTMLRRAREVAGKIMEEERVIDDVLEALTELAACQLALLDTDGLDEMMKVADAMEEKRRKAMEKLTSALANLAAAAYSLGFSEALKMVKERLEVKG